MAGPALAQQIVVQGNSRVDAETIRSYVTGAGSGSLEEARRNLLRDRHVLGCPHRPQRRRDVVVSVRENTAHQPGRVRGQHARSRGQTLEREVQTKARGAYEPGDRSRPTCSASSRSTGARAAASRSVTPRVVDLPNGRIDVVYTINEGDKTGIKEIRFVGNNAGLD